MADREASLPLRSLVAEARLQLTKAGIDNAAFDARILIAGATGLTPGEIVTKPEFPVGHDQANAVRSLLKRRADGEPVHRILGKREFYGLMLGLNDATLEPRPDTEILIDLVLPKVLEVTGRKGECRILDLGTGTGAIALAILDQVSRTTAIGVDISGEALAMAEENARQHALSGRFQALQSDWFENVTGTFHVIVANPPYIVSAAMDSLQRDVKRFDPHLALDGGADGLAAYRTIAASARPFLCAGGYLAVEIGYNQKTAVIEAFVANGWKETAAARDLSGHDRALLFAG